MAELPFMRLFVGDYLMDTRHLSLEEHGAYMALMMEYWVSGAALPDNDRRFARLLGITPRKWAAMRPAIEEFFITDGVVWLHKRIEIDLKHAREKVLASRKAGFASAMKRKTGKKANKNNKGTSTGVERALNGRATRIERTCNGTGNETATSQNQSISPLPPLGSSKSDAHPLDRSAGASVRGGAKSIGEVLKK